MAIYYPLSATLALFANILENPRSPEAFSDIDLMAVATAFLNRSIQIHKHLGGIMRIFAELNHLAGLIVRDAQMIWLSELKSQAEEMADADLQDVSSTTSQGQPAQHFASPASSDHAIPPAIGYSDDNLDLFDPSLGYMTNESFMDFPYEMTDTWTEPGPE